jgi:hypothetical protein
MGDERIILFLCPHNAVKSVIAARVRRLVDTEAPKVSSSKERPYDVEHA